MLSLQPYDIMITHITRHVKRTKAKKRNTAVSRQQNERRTKSWNNYTNALFKDGLVVCYKQIHRSIELNQRLESKSKRVYRLGIFHVDITVFSYIWTRYSWSTSKMQYGINFSFFTKNLDFWKKFGGWPFWYTQKRVYIYL